MSDKQPVYDLTETARSAKGVEIDPIARVVEQRAELKHRRRLEHRKTFTKEFSTDYLEPVLDTVIWGFGGTLVGVIGGCVDYVSKTLSELMQGGLEFYQQPVGSELVLKYTLIGAATGLSIGAAKGLTRLVLKKRKFKRCEQEIAIFDDPLNNR